MSDRTLLCVGEGLFELGLDGDTLREGIGGDAANVAVMAALMGARARLAGRVGDDALGRRLVAFWQKSGVRIDDVLVDPVRPTGIYVNRSTPDGHHFDYHRSGSAGSSLDEAQVAALDFTGVAFVHITGIGLAVSSASAKACAAAAAIARARSAKVSFAANVRAGLAPDLDLLRAHAVAADVVFCSEEDAAALFGGTAGALDAFAESDSELIVSLGADGAVHAVRGQEIHIRAPVVTVVDAAGAGDALAGAYLAGRLCDQSPESALAEAVVAAAVSCTAAGCALSYPTAAAVRAATS